jgi:pteridine reductase
MRPERTVIVTGSGKRRLGNHIVEALAGRGYGVVIHYHTSANEANETVVRLRGRRIEAIAVPADLADEAAARRLVQTGVDHFGRIDVLVNCAAVWGAKRLEDVTAADVRLNLDVNILGTFLCAQQAGLVMVGQKEGG